MGKPGEGEAKRRTFNKTRAIPKKTANMDVKQSKYRQHPTMHANNFEPTSVHITYCTHLPNTTHIINEGGLTQLSVRARTNLATNHDRCVLRNPHEPVLADRRIPAGTTDASHRSRRKGACKRRRQRDADRDLAQS